VTLRALFTSSNLPKQHADQAHRHAVDRLPVVTKLTHTNPTSMSAHNPRARTGTPPRPSIGRKR